MAWRRIEYESDNCGLRVGRGGAMGEKLQLVGQCACGRGTSGGGPCCSDIGSRAERRASSRAGIWNQVSGEELSSSIECGSLCTKVVSASSLGTPLLLLRADASPAMCPYPMAMRGRVEGAR